MAKNRERVLAGILVCLLAFAILSSVFCISVNACHNCIGEGCAVCAQVATAEHTLKEFLPAAVTASSVAIVLFCAAVILAPFFENTRENTLVTLKVKLLN